MNAAEANESLVRLVRANGLVGAIQRAPTGVQTKLIGALLAGVVLVIAVGLLGLGAIGDANDRAASLRMLQQRATVYRALQADVEQVHQLLGLRAGGADLNTYVGQTPTTAPTGATLQLLDQTIATTLTRLGRGGDVTDLVVAATPDEREALDRILVAETKLAAVMDRIIAFDGQGLKEQAARLQGTDAEPLKTELEGLADGLVSGTTSATNDLIVANQASLDSTRLTFVAVAVVSVLLALGLGLALARSVISPIKRIELRLTAITAGDFDGHVDVPNRDELGTLAANINLMNDELGRVYRELASASRHKSEFLANMSHELRTPLNAISGSPTCSRRRWPGPLNERQRQYVEDVGQAGQHLLSLINDILDLSKVEAGRMDVALTEISIADVLESGLTSRPGREHGDGRVIDLLVRRLVEVVVSQPLLDHRAERLARTAGSRRARTPRPAGCAAGRGRPTRPGAGRARHRGRRRRGAVAASIHQGTLASVPCGTLDPQPCGAHAGDIAVVPRTHSPVDGPFSSQRRRRA